MYRLDPDDKPIWCERFGGDKVEFGRAVAGDPSNLWIAGHSGSFGPKTRVYLVRLNLQH